MSHRSRRKSQLNKNSQKLGLKFEQGEERNWEKFGALWVNLVAKDESHIPLIISMERPLSFDGENMTLKLGDFVFNGGF